MTKKQFKEGLLRGQGCCIQAAQAAPESYYDLILWACRHELAFDAQCEGTRSWFVYQLIQCYQDNPPFLEEIIKQLEHTKSVGSWKLLYLSEILYYFSCDENSAATQALWHKYETLYSILLRKRCRPRTSFFHERDDFESLCLVLGRDRGAILKIVEDIGRLYREKTLYGIYDFDWFYDSKVKRILSTLKNRAKKSENIAEFIRISEVYEQECQKRRNNQVPRIPEKGVALSLWLKRKADENTVLMYAKKYSEHSDLAIRAEALIAFSRCPYPGDPSPILEDAQSNNEKLKEAAMDALENIRHPLVREFTLQNLSSDTRMFLPLLIKNYQKQDASLLTNIVKSISVDFNDDHGWHGIFCDVLRMVDDSLNPPIDLLQHIYKMSYCSCCRADALRQMGARRMLNNEMLQESIFDSNEDIRAYANQCLKRRRPDGV